LNGYGIKIQRILYGWNLITNSVEILGTLEFGETLLASSLLHLIARKNKFPAKGDMKFEFPLNMGFGLILR
jgi:hypothetical protein